jgi:hypothetical protein
MSVFYIWKRHDSWRTRGLTLKASPQDGLFLVLTSLYCPLSHLTRIHLCDRMCEKRYGMSLPKSGYKRHCSFYLLSLTLWEANCHVVRISSGKRLTAVKHHVNKLGIRFSSSCQVFSRLQPEVID